MTPCSVDNSATARSLCYTSARIVQKNMLITQERQRASHPARGSLGQQNIPDTSTPLVVSPPSHFTALS